MVPAAITMSLETVVLPEAAPEKPAFESVIAPSPPIVEAASVFPTSVTAALNQTFEAAAAVGKLTVAALLKVTTSQDESEGHVAAGANPS